MFTMVAVLFWFISRVKSAEKGPNKRYLRLKAALFKLFDHRVLMDN